MAWLLISGTLRAQKLQYRLLRGMASFLFLLTVNFLHPHLLKPAEQASIGEGVTFDRGKRWGNSFLGSSRSLSVVGAQPLPALPTRQPASPAGLDNAQNGATCPRAAPRAPAGRACEPAQPATPRLHSRQKRAVECADAKRKIGFSGYGAYVWKFKGIRKRALYRPCLNLISRTHHFYQADMQF